MIRRLAPALLLGAAFALPSLPAAAQFELRCESRDFQYQHCSTGASIRDARLVRQESRASCVQGRTWGWDRRGVWVTQGCAGIFAVSDFGAPPGPGPLPGPGRDIVRCESRNFAHNFCGTDARVVSADLVRQHSRAACVLGRTWGWRGNGIWVSEGCDGDFRIRTDFRPGPPTPGPGFTVCESHEYRYNFCPTGPIRSAQLVEQRSQASCVQGRSWGWRNDGIWVDNGCEGVFRVRTR